METTFVLDVGGTNIKYGFIDENARLSQLREAPTEAEKGGSALLDKIICLARENSGYKRIGVSTCGQVDRVTGGILYATDNVPGYTGVQVGQILKQTFQVPVAVENDVNAAAIGEANFGAAKPYRDFLCVTYGTGIGGAIFTNGGLYTGHRGSAGELGHFVLHKDGLPCTCGFSGCYEAYASTGALARAAGCVLGRETNGREIFALLNQGNKPIKVCVDSWIEEVAAGLASLIHIFEPEAIVLGGGIMREAYIYQELCRRVPSLVMESFRQVRLAQASLGNSAGLYGAFFAANQLSSTDRV